MGVDQRAVVDPERRVRCIKNLRVAAAPIMTIIPSANLNCPTMMIGEKAADLIAGKEPLPKAICLFSVNLGDRTYADEMRYETIELDLSKST